MLRLVAMHYSPWSEKARWALDHHKIEYVEEAHVPMLGEPLLRLKVRRLRGKVTVPVLLDGAHAFDDSLEIARHAELLGKGSRLFPDGQVAIIRTWNTTSEAVMLAGRPLVVAKIAESEDALLESLPSNIPHGLRRASLPAARLATQFLAKKYGFELRDGARHEQTIRETLEPVRKSIAKGPYLMRDFSYADIAMATALHFVLPVGDEYIELGPATRAAWTQPALVEEFGDLLAWRDGIYEKHRRV